MADLCIREVIKQMETGEIPYLLRELDHLQLKNGILYRKRIIREKIAYQLVLPERFQSDVLKCLHNDLGHMGIDRTLHLVWSRFYWQKMAADVENKIKTCGHCIRRKTLPEKAASLVNILTTRLLQLICIDFLSLEPDCSNTKDVLVLTDHFAKCSVCFGNSYSKPKSKDCCKVLMEAFHFSLWLP